MAATAAADLVKGASVAALGDAWPLLLALVEALVADAGSRDGAGGGARTGLRRLAHVTCASQHGAGAGVPRVHGARGDGEEEAVGVGGRRRR